MSSSQEYREILLNSLAYLGFSDIREIEKMTLREYSLRMEAYQLRKLSQREAIASIAWANQTVQATTGGKHPKPKYKRFEAFFDRDAAEAKIRQQYGDTYALRQNKKKDASKLFLSRYEEYQKLKKAGRIDLNAWRKETD